MGDQGYELHIDSDKETCHGDYEVDSSKQLDSIKECAERCDDFEKCRFFYYNTKQWCGMYEACDTTREASYPGSTYEKRSLSGLKLSFYSIQVTFLLTYSPNILCSRTCLLF